MQSLLEAGLSEKAIAERTRSTQPTIHRIGKGRQCYWEIGSRVVALAEQVRRESEPEDNETKHHEAA